MMLKGALHFLTQSVPFWQFSVLAREMRELIFSELPDPRMFILLVYLQPIFLHEEFKTAYKNANSLGRSNKLEIRNMRESKGIEVRCKLWSLCYRGDKSWLRASQSLAQERKMMNYKMHNVPEGWIGCRRCSTTVLKLQCLQWIPPEEFKEQYPSNTLLRTQRSLACALLVTPNHEIEVFLPEATKQD